MALARGNNMATSDICKLGPSLSGCTSHLNTSNYHVLSTGKHVSTISLNPPSPRRPVRQVLLSSLADEEERGSEGS